MTTAAVKQYFEMLARDDKFVKKIAATGDDKAAKLQLIKEHGLEFTKEEFEEAARECTALLFKEDGELTDKGLEAVSGGGFGGAFGGLLIGSLIGGVTGVVSGTVTGAVAGGLVRPNASGMDKVKDIVLGGILCGTGGSISGFIGGAVTGGGIGLFFPF